MSIYTI